MNKVKMNKVKRFFRKTQGMTYTSGGLVVAGGTIALGAIGALGYSKLNNAKIPTISRPDINFEGFDQAIDGVKEVLDVDIRKNFEVGKYNDPGFLLLYLEHREDGTWGAGSFSEEWF